MTKYLSPHRGHKIMRGHCSQTADLFGGAFGLMANAPPPDAPAEMLSRAAERAATVRAAKKRAAARARGSRLEEMFREYDRDNPEIWKFFKRLALIGIAQGRRRLSANQIFEIIRWESPVMAVGDAFKINNSYRSYYARKFEAEFPQHAGKFETRALRA